MQITKFTDYVKVNESAGLTLYRVVPIKKGEKLNVNDPGTYYVDSKSKIKDLTLKSESGDMYVVTINAKASDINDKASEKESDIQGVKVIALNKDADKDIVSIQPYKKAA